MNVFDEILDSVHMEPGRGIAVRGSRGMKRCQRCRGKGRAGRYIWGSRVPRIKGEWGRYIPASREHVLDESTRLLDNGAQRWYRRCQACGGSGRV